jgi:serine/threonine protein kinase
MTPPREISALMQVAAPIRETNGAVLGALGLILDPEEEFTRILSVARPGDSGETYAFDRHGVLISRSRFESDLKRLALMDPESRGGSALTLELREPGPEFRPGVRPGSSLTNWPLTRLVSAAIDGSPGITLESSRDYRGVPVVGTWRWLPHLGFGVVTQLDESEAFQPARQLQQVFYVLLLLLILAAVALMWISNAGIRWRQRLGEAELRARRLGQYTLLEKIGEGGMGVVYKARHALMRRDTAVKLLLPEHADDATVARFEKEVRLTCKLKHPCTIQVFDYGRTFDGIFYYAMEFLEGLTLQRLVDSYGPLPPSRVIHVLIQVCDSLAEAHALGLVHRDIKPANIFLCCHGGMTDLVKVLDFGLVGSAVAAADDDEGDSGRHAGTPQYMAPEAFRHDSQPDLRMDLYSLGATAYFLVTGNELFQADSVEAFRAQHESSPAAFPPRAIRGPALEALEELVLQCLEKSPANRPASARVLAQALRRLQATDAWTQADSQAWWEAHPEILGDRPPHAGAAPATTSQSPSYSSASSPTPTLLIPVTANRSPRPGID